MTEATAHWNPIVIILYDLLWFNIFIYCSFKFMGYVQNRVWKSTRKGDTYDR